MALKTEPNYFGECILTEGPGEISREVRTIITGQNLKANTVLGKITASGKYTALAPAAGDGSQTAAEILLEDCDATSADKTAVTVARLAEINNTVLNWSGANAGQQTTARAQLAANNIIVRDGV